jgi:aminoglycoside phosphotransferase (APT) family kinase protein
MDRLSHQKLPAPVPCVIGVEPTSDLFGAPFLLMTRLPGEIVPQNPNYNLAGWVAEMPVEKRAAVWENGVRALAGLQRIDWRDGFEFMARGTEPGIEGYLTWTEEWMRWAVAGRDYAIGEAAIDYLKRAMPKDAPINVLWGDGQPSNVLFDTKTGEVTGLLDWELALLGPSEIDLAWWLMFDELLSTRFHVKRLEGLPGAERLTAVYEEAAGRRVAHMDYYGVLVRLHMAIVMIRAVDRQVAQGRFKSQNDAWSHNAFTLGIAERIGLPPVVISSDYADFNNMLMNKQ